MKRAVIRLPSEVVDRLDRLAEELRVAHPDESYSRASVVRALISSGLTLAETHEERLLDVARRAARTAPRRVIVKRS
jgi:predicted transcriptional regulator